MTTINLIVLYVEDMAESSAFYEKLLGQTANALSSGFTAFHLPGGLMLGLWRKSTAQPEAEGGPGVMEVGIMTSAEGGVSALYQSARDEGHQILQPLVSAAFGPTFVIADPDGHRIRFCEPDK